MNFGEIVKQERTRKGFTLRELAKRGDHSKARLTNKEASEIRDLFFLGNFSRREISEIYKVRVSIIYRIIRNETYKIQEVI